METTTNNIVKPSEAQKRMIVGEKFYMKSVMEGGEMTINTIEKFEDGKVFIRGDKLVVSFPMTEEFDNEPDKEVVWNRPGFRPEKMIIKSPRFIKAPELNQ